jgi:hypothetical protein
MSNSPNKSKSASGFFATKSVVSKKGATLKVTKLVLTQQASELLKANSKGINVGAPEKQNPIACATAD